MFNKYLALWVILLNCCVANVYANVQELGNSNELGLENNSSKPADPKDYARSQDKISNLGHGAYIRQYNDFGKSMVEVHPENASYYYNEKEIQEPKADDGVYDRQTPQWMIGQW